ncbi:MAG TPA: hypothetical protein VGF30_09265 [Bacteroidia bacterium]
MLSLFDTIQGNWISTDIVPVLDHKSNFSNWIEASAVPGYITLYIGYDTNKAKNVCWINIPVASHYNLEDKGYFSIYSGRFDHMENKILIWQNEQVPAEIPYLISDAELELLLFGRKVKFKRKTDL